MAGVPSKELIVDVRTRWNSTHDMIERALELREPLDSMTTLDLELGKYRLAAEEWQLLQSILQLLEAFKLCTTHLCAASHPTLTIAVPVYNFLIDRLEDYRDTYEGPLDAIKAATDAAIDKPKARYSKAGVEVYAVATILDPRYKLNYYRAHEWEAEWVEEALDGFKNAFARYRCSPAPRAREQAPMKWGGGSLEELVESSLKHRCVAKPDELKQYLDAPSASPGTDVLQWWKANAASYPCLAAMARDYLAIPATGAPVERVFSGGTDLVRPKRGALNERSIELTMRLKNWLEQPH